MSNLEALSLKDNSLPSIKVNATVLFSILNSYVRRSARDARVIGTLLGEVKDGTIIVRIISCYYCYTYECCRFLTALLYPLLKRVMNYTLLSIRNTIRRCTDVIAEITRKSTLWDGTPPQV